MNVIKCKVIRFSNRNSNLPFSGGVRRGHGTDYNVEYPFNCFFCSLYIKSKTSQEIKWNQIYKYISLCAWPKMELQWPGIRRHGSQLRATLKPLEHHGSMGNENFKKISHTAPIKGNPKTPRITPLIAATVLVLEKSCRLGRKKCSQVYNLYHP